MTPPRSASSHALRVLFAAALLTAAATPLGCSGDDGSGATTPDTSDDASPDDAGEDTATDVEDTDADSGGDTAEDTPDADTGDAADTGPDVVPDATPDIGPPPDDPRVHDLALGCFAVEAVDASGASLGFLAATDDGDAFAFDATALDDAAAFFFKPSDLATYLLHDAGERYLVASTDADGFARLETLESDITRIEDGYLPGAQWVFEGSALDPTYLQMRHLASSTYLRTTGVGVRMANAARIRAVATEGCVAVPELSLDATGEVVPRTWDDGSVWGYAEPHTHLFTNLAFGGGGIFHGAPFHPLGVEHALGSCEPFHGPEGRADLMGISTSPGTELTDFIGILASGLASEPNHATDGYPTFTSWPDARDFPSHQSQYYRWIERAWMSGLRLMVNHGTGYEVLCELIVGADIGPARYACDDMVGIDRGIEATYALERYIDAHHGGPGQGWFRVVTSPEEARAVIEEGKLAVLLGIEVSNLFDCYVTERDGRSRCTQDDVLAALDHYHARGVRVLFPNHKTDNGFSPGDGSKGIFELANWVTTGHYNQFTEIGCPEHGPGFDDGSLGFANLNQPREDYFAPPVFDFDNFASDPLATVFENAAEALPEPAPGNFCQEDGLTDLGIFLLEEMMRRGMLIEVDHLPRFAYQQAYTMLEAANYPALGTHGNSNNGRIYPIGGLSTSRFSTCPEGPDGIRDRRLTERGAIRAELGFLPTEPWSFDLNGFAPVPGGRFAEGACGGAEQTNPVEYPFTGFGGDVTFTEPVMGERVIDFNTEGMVHIGMMAELIEDVVRTTGDPNVVEPLFWSAEAYIRMWERAEARAAELGGE